MAERSDDFGNGSNENLLNESLTTDESTILDEVTDTSSVTSDSELENGMQESVVADQVVADEIGIAYISNCSKKCTQFCFQLHI